MREVFEALLQGLAQRLQVSATDLLVGATMQVDGVDFRILLHESPVEAFIILLCRFGPVPQDDALSLSRLLQTNLQLVDGETSSFFAMDEVTQDIVFCLRTMLLDTTVEDLLECIQVCTAEAKVWNDRSYVRPPPLRGLMP